jgi:hypothetical protein
MKNQNRLVFLLLSLLFINITCKKTNTDSVQSPPTSKNSFSCKVNGTLWVPYWRCADLAVAGMAEMKYSIKPADGIHTLPFILNAQLGNFSLGKTTFLLQQNPPPGGHYIHHTGNVIDSLGILFITDSLEYVNYTFPDRQSARYFNIETLDTVNHIVSGNFAFTLYGNNSHGGLDSVIITEGQFDFQIGEFSKCSK